MLKKFSLLSLSAAVLASMSINGVPTVAQAVTLKWHTFIPPVANPSKFYKPWAAKIAKDSGGKLKVKLFWTMQLGGKPTQLLDQAKDGVVDIVWTLPGFTPGRMPRVEPFELPFVHKDPVSTTLALQDFQAKHLGPDLKDYHPLLLHVHAGFLFQTKKPVLRLEDLKGMKIRAASRGGVWMLQAFGAVGIGMPLPRIPGALSKGVIDGVTLPYEIAPAVKTQDLVSHFSILEGHQPRLGTNVFTLLMNKKKYEGLPSDLKRVLDANSGRNIAKAAGELWVKIEEPGRKVIASKKKNKFHTIPAAEVDRMKAAAGPVIDRWFDEMKKIGVDGPTLLKDARAMIEKYSK